MSALAAILHSRGHIISGSDLVENEQTQNLRALGVKIYIGHRKSNSIHADLIVVNGAISDNNPELKVGIPTITREHLLAEIESTYPIRIAVAGAHGKSTTTAMIANILVTAGLDPTVHNGAVMHINGKASNNILGGDKIFLTEACEFKRSFLTLNPTIAVITNIDYDHVDCFKDVGEVKESFDKFAAKAQTVIRTEETPAIDFELKVPGSHNLENARVAAQVGRVLGVSEHIIRTALENFCGIDRRFQKVGVIDSCDIISDYAHHPTEIAATIKTAQTIYSRYLLVFQPHTYTRTMVLFDDFVKILQDCDCVLYKTYAARELPIIGGRASDIARVIGAKYFATPTMLNRFLEKVAHKYDAVILTGAGNVQEHFMRIARQDA